MSDSKIKLAIGIPNTGVIKAQTAFALCRMLKGFPHDYDVLFQEGSVLHQNRERLANKAIELKCTHLLFLDTDMFFDKDAVLKLLERDKDIIGVNAHLRKLPPVSTLKFLNGKVPKGKLITCDSAGTGFLLIKTEVFKRLSHPWFFWEVDEIGQTITGEDFWFCRKAREAGFKIWVDLTIKVGHIGDYIF